MKEVCVAAHWQHVGMEHPNANSLAVCCIIDWYLSVTFMCAQVGRGRAVPTHFSMRRVRLGEITIQFSLLVFMNPVATVAYHLEQMKSDIWIS